jgi:hypothetical protein
MPKAGLDVKQDCLRSGEVHNYRDLVERLRGECRCLSIVLAAQHANLVPTLASNFGDQRPSFS